MQILFLARTERSTSLGKIKRWQTKDTVKHTENNYLGYRGDNRFISIVPFERLGADRVGD